MGRISSNRGKIALHFDTFFTLMHTIKAQLTLENLLNNINIFFHFPPLDQNTRKFSRNNILYIIIFYYNSMYQTTVAGLCSKPSPSQIS